MENKDWRDEFREYFDKVLKAKKPTIENKDIYRGIIRYRTCIKRV